MTQTQSQPTQPQVVDLVLEPFAEREALTNLLRQGLLPVAAAEQLVPRLLQAIAQLEAIGDLHGAVALSELLHQLAPLHALV